MELYRCRLSGSSVAEVEGLGFECMLGDLSFFTMILGEEVLKPCREVSAFLVIFKLIKRIRIYVDLIFNQAILKQ